MITTWYLQSQRTWDKLCHSCRGSSFLPRGAFPEGRAYAFPQRLHAGSLEALRVSRPEAVVLAINNRGDGPYHESRERQPTRTPSVVFPARKNSFDVGICPGATPSTCAGMPCSMITA